MEGNYNLAACSIAALFGLVLRSAVSIYPYSGMKNPPMFGDYEAQRHWMEVTVNLPTNKWYWNSTDNDLLYWGLDYPPLTAYHSWVMGKVAQGINSSWVALHASHGMESEEHKQFMRTTVLVTDSLTFIPSCLMFFLWALPPLMTKEADVKITPFWGLILTLIYPALTVIDHGHFQYNCASLGLFIASVACFLRDVDLVGSILFCLALSYKQMALYHALPIFCFLLSKCLHLPPLKGVIKLVGLGLTVCLTFGVVWFPFIGDLEQLGQVLHRIFPVARGLYEDKVANFWCAFSVVVKLKQLLHQTTMVTLSGGVTLLANAPPCFLLLVRSPCKKRFLYALVVSSLTFFLFSYQVHEKSILLPGAAIMLVSVFVPYESLFFALSSTLSMWSLIVKDGLVIPSIMLTVLHGLISIGLHSRLCRARRWLLCFSLALYITLCTCHTMMKPPSRLPDLFPVLISVFSCAQFMVFLAFFYWKMFTEH